MNSIANGDCYAWFCDRCDSRNLTPWARRDAEPVTCGACRHPFHHHGSAFAEELVAAVRPAAAFSL